MKKLITIISFFISAELYALTSVEAETHSIAPVIKQVKELNDRLGAENVLVVFDIDNTTIKTEDFIPGDAWFEWQWKQVGTDSPYAVSEDHGEFLELLRKLYENTRFLPAEFQLTHSGITKFLQSGNPFFYLTSRNEGMLSTTYNSLKEQGLQFEENLFKASGLEQGVAAGNLGSWAIKNKYSEQRLATVVQYYNNVFYTAGFHKGMMLKAFLDWTKFKPKAIVFMDDKQKHTRGVQSEFSKSDIEVYTYTYHAVIEKVHAFEEMDKSEVHKMYLKKINSLVLSK